METTYTDATLDAQVKVNPANFAAAMMYQKSEIIGEAIIREVLRLHLEYKVGLDTVCEVLNDTIPALLAAVGRTDCHVGTSSTITNQTGVEIEPKRAENFVGMSGDLFVRTVAGTVKQGKTFNKTAFPSPVKSK